MTAADAAPIATIVVVAFYAIARHIFAIAITAIDIAIVTFITIAYDIVAMAIDAIDIATIAVVAVDSPSLQFISP